MTVRVVGAGLGRTGTASLRKALEVLLEGPCYHMFEVRDDPVRIETWRRAATGEPTDWNAVFDGYVAVVDWPAAAFWREIADAFPDAVILHSTRADTETWQQSAANTIFQSPYHRNSAFEEMWLAVAARTFDGSYLEPEVTMSGYERHNADVLATAPPGRLVRYQPGDGWTPLCAALGLAVPDVPFPHSNTTRNFRTDTGID